MDEIQTARAELQKATDRVLHLVSLTPDEHLFWKPSASARSIGEVVAHTAHALKNILGQLQGTPFPPANSTEATPLFLEHDRQFTDRATLLDYFRTHRDNYDQYLAALTSDDLDVIATLPFGLGEAPVRFFMKAGADHTASHIPQIEYIQTIYGDHDWHTGF
jgi:uncharacterized damage-inducible protein DinB